MLPPPPSSEGRNWLSTDTSRRPIPTTPKPTRRWSGRTRRSSSCPLVSCACPREGSDRRCCCRCRRSIAWPTCLANLRRVELTWRADHYELCLTLDTGKPLPPVRQEGALAGVDLGEARIATVTTTRRHALVVSERQLRSCKQWRNKAHSVLQERLSRCQQGSRRAQRLNWRKAQVSARLFRQQRDLLHQAARKVVDFCAQEGVSQIAVGDVRDIQTGVSLGKQTNQKISQWPHGQFVRYLREKAVRLGISVEWIDEAYSTKTCSHSGHVQSSSPRGRRFRCLGCGARVHRDVTGANNICSRAVYGCYSKIQAETVKYLRPIGVAPLTRATSS
jgi:IS605 OrfB family transposase